MIKPFRIYLVLLFCLIYSITYGQEQVAATSQHFEMDSLRAEMQKDDKRWLAFFKNEQVLTGIYRLKAGTEDKQSPHDTDEVYYVLKGKSKFRAGEKVYSHVAEGSILFVKAFETHQFYDIEEDLELLVFFDQ